jgi:phosphotriesterase-related protein
MDQIEMPVSQNDATETVQTARGAIALDDLGVVLSHEHLFINLMRERRGDGLINDEALVIDEVTSFVQQGGSTIIDLTSAELTEGALADADPRHRTDVLGCTRDPANVLAIQRVSLATGVNVVLGTGRYRDPFIDRRLVDRAGVSGLAAEWVDDIERGFADTGVRAAVIGEVGSDGWFISAIEERCLRAAARAHHETGVPIYTHAARWEVGLAQLDLLEECGVHPSRIAIGHVDTVPSVDYALAVARRGAFVGLDTIYSAALMPAVLERLQALVQAGHADQVLLSHDVCVMSQLASRGGPGYGLVTGALRQAALGTGAIDDDGYHHMLTANPRRLLQRGTG